MSPELEQQLREIDPLVSLNYGEPNPVTVALAEAARSIGVPRWTNGNIYEVMERIAVWQDIRGALLRGPENEEIFVTGEEVRRHIGMTACVRFMNAAQFMERMRDLAFHRVRREARLRRAG